MNSKIENLRQSRDVLQTTKTLNRKLTATQQVSPSAQGTYVNLVTGGVGMRGLIRDILKAKGSVWLGGIQLPQDRADAISAAMYTEDILDQARIRFTGGTTRYPPHSLKACLGITMLERGEVGRIQLSPSEDGQRRSARPRCKWYWALA